MTAAGELLIVGLSTPQLQAVEERLLRRIQPHGVILFGRNLGTEPALRELMAGIRAAVPRVVLYVDAEGGRVDRLRGIAGPAPSAATLGALPPAAAARAGSWVGAALRACGFDVDFAPVVDLDRGERDNALDGRTFGATPRAVAARAGAFLEGLHRAGIGGCVKHFPGLGAARRDTHLEGAPIQLSREALALDLAPFTALAAKAGAVMVGHATYPALDPGGRPASLSPAIATKLLRGGLRFRGVAVSDDLEMQALQPWGDPAVRAVAALRAGCDLLPLCADLDAAVEASRRLAARSLSARRAEAMRRVDRWRRHLAALKRAGRESALPVVRRRLAAIAGL